MGKLMSYNVSDFTNLMSYNTSDFINFPFLWSSVCWRVHGQCVVTGLLWRRQSSLAFNHRASAEQNRLCWHCQFIQGRTAALQQCEGQAICTGDAFSAALPTDEAQKEFWAAAAPKERWDPCASAHPVISLPRWEQHRSGLKSSRTFGSSQEQLNMLLTHHQGQ